jgi:hypothetical protein
MNPKMIIPIVIVIILGYIISQGGFTPGAIVTKEATADWKSGYMRFTVKGETTEWLGGDVGNTGKKTVEFKYWTSTQKLPGSAIPLEECKLFYGSPVPSESGYTSCQVEGTKLGDRYNWILEEGHGSVNCGGITKQWGTEELLAAGSYGSNNPDFFRTFTVDLSGLRSCGTAQIEQEMTFVRRDLSSVTTTTIPPFIPPPTTTLPYDRPTTTTPDQPPGPTPGFLDRLKLQILAAWNTFVIQLKSLFNR